MSARAAACAGLLVCLALACSKDEAAPATPALGGNTSTAGSGGVQSGGGAGEGGVRVTGGAAGSTTVGTRAMGGAGGASAADCGAVSLLSGLVVRTDLTAGMPVATAGNLVDGSYDLVRSQQEGASPDAGTRMSVQIRDNGLRFDAIRQVGTGAEERASYTISHEAGGLIITQRCPAAGLGKFEGYHYSATSTQLTLIRESFFLEFKRRM